jgi:hypothetical protein
MLRGNYTEIATPALKKELANNVLKDLNYFWENNWNLRFDDIKLFKSVSEGFQLIENLLADADSKQLGLVVTPNLYRLLGNSSFSYKENNIRDIRIELENFIFSLIERLIVCKYIFPKTQLAYSFPIPSDLAIQNPTFPLSDFIFVNELKPTELRLDNKNLVIITTKGENKFPFKDIIKTIDGFNPDSQNKLGNTNSYLHQNGSILLKMIDELNIQASIPIETNEEIRGINLRKLLEADYYKKILNKLIEGANLISETSPEVFKDIFTLMDYITIVTGGRYVGSSDIFYHGSSVFNPDDKWSDITFADHLIHEGAHLKLNAINELTPLLYNPFSYEAKSPIRKDPRPLYGVLHSTFVFLELVLFFELLQPKLKDNEEVNFRLNRHLKGFYDGMKSIESAADFTNDGYKLFKSMKYFEALFYKTHGIPNPKLFVNLANDYVI